MRTVTFEIQNTCTLFTSVLIALSIVVASTGCRAIANLDSLGPNAGTLNQPQMPNPLSVPMLDRWLVMEQISDELDDYFKIFREERIRVLDGIMSEGRIETHPRIGGTLLEPWRRDSMPGFERMHATLQTIRRFAKVRVVPAGDHYQINLQVFKELEDLPQPVGASVAGRLLRHDSTLDIDREDILLTAVNRGWIPQGRDLLLEQQILAPHAPVIEGLRQIKVEEARRSTRLPVRDLQWAWQTEREGEVCLELAFTLPTGAFATTVMAEIIKPE